MKQLFYLLAISLLAVSCIDVNDDKTNIKTINLVVNENDWVENTDSKGFNRYYSCSFDMPEISTYVYNSGVVNTYITFDYASQPLPYVRHLEDAVGNRWTRTVDYEYERGKMRIFVTNSDFIEDLPEKMTFKVALIW
jgi:hypothetical protein